MKLLSSCLSLVAHFTRTVRTAATIAAATVLSLGATGQNCEIENVPTPTASTVGYASGTILTTNFVPNSFGVFDAPNWDQVGAGSGDLSAISDDGRLGVVRRLSPSGWLLDLWALTETPAVLLGSISHPLPNSFDVVNQFPVRQPSLVFDVFRLFVGSTSAANVEMWIVAVDYFTPGSPTMPIPPFVAQTFTSQSPAASGSFGWSVAASFSPSGQLLIAVGDPNADDAVTNGGRVEFFREDAVPSEYGFFIYDEPQAQFGGKVDVDWNESLGRFTAIAGSPTSDLAGGDAGFVVMFDDGGAGFEQTGFFTGAPGTNLGNAVSIQHDRALVGAPSYSTPALAGSVRVYRRDGPGYVLESTVSNPDGAPGDAFGIRVCLEKEDPFTGVATSNRAVVASGSGAPTAGFTVFDFPLTNAVETVRLDTFPFNPVAFLPSQTGGAALGQTWDPVVSHATFMPDAILDLLAISLTPTEVPLPPFGDLLCLPPFIGDLLTSPPGTPFAVPIPDNCNFIGLTLCTQAVSTNAAGTILFTNAIDITIGSL